MNSFVLKKFEGFLDEHGYDGHYKKSGEDVSVNHARTVFGRKRWVVEVLGKDGFVIQVFILMRDESRTHHKKYPVWQKYHQSIGKSGVSVNPAVFIATLNEKGKWSVYSAASPEDECDLEYIVNYELAFDRFEMRLEQAWRANRVIKTFKWSSWALAVIFSVYLIIHIVTYAGELSVLPLTNEIVILGAVIAFLILFPIIIPHIKGISFNGLEITW